MESIHLSHYNTQVTFDARDGVHTVRLETLLFHKNPSALNQLRLTVRDENNVPLWAAPLADFAGGQASEVAIGTSFAVQDRIMVELIAGSGPAEFTATLTYQLNLPDAGYVSPA
ncbi:hypothetical protein GCM10023187_14020 [Nibrella viscosa]|uniref:Uncharacterized protein n=1 Tax=Nibrella viscosa TaxID=1084524 RepID=A0ABP8K5H9_9BACT